MAAVLRCWQRPPAEVPEPYRLTLRNAVPVKDPKGLVRGTIDSVIERAKSDARGWTYVRAHNESVEVEMARLTGGSFGVARSGREIYCIFVAPHRKIEISGQKLPDEISIKHLKVENDELVAELRYGLQIKMTNDGCEWNPKSDDKYEFDLVVKELRPRINKEDGTIEGILNIKFVSGDKFGNKVSAFRLQLLKEIIEELNNIGKDILHKKAYDIWNNVEDSEELKLRNNGKSCERVLQSVLSEEISKIIGNKIGCSLREKVVNVKSRIVDRGKAKYLGYKYEYVKKAKSEVKLNPDILVEDIVRYLYGIEDRTDMIPEVLFLTLAPHIEWQDGD